jgi:hypothetical protein
MYHRSISGYVLLIIKLLLLEIGFMGREGRPFEVRGIEDEAVPLRLLA